MFLHTNLWRLFPGIVALLSPVFLHDKETGLVVTGCMHTHTHTGSGQLEWWQAEVRGDRGRDIGLKEGLRVDKSREKLIR